MTAQRIATTFDRLVSPLAIFLAVYFAAFTALNRLHAPADQPHLIACISVSLATAVVIVAWEKGRWRLGLAAPPGRIARELLGGAALAALLIGAVDLVIIAATPLRHGPGEGFPWREIAVLFLPAAIHEELLFRGYPFQKLRAWNRGVALFGGALLFSAVHAGNAAVTPIALLNIFIAGVILGLAYERHLRLWFPIGLHFAWNVLSGPVLGHEVSGYRLPQSILGVEGEGAAWIAGGDFGIEGSLVMTFAECAAAGWLVFTNRISSSSRGVGGSEYHSSPDRGPGVF
ncbi:MAG TPA: CPBP family intramembrane glutamic endopeptidase [Thermoanaerobaculia bacterium]|nr:CPBP family intramembrane glutamic endopeptidase [Thermoanaerobaculia bacterium]